MRPTDLPEVRHLPLFSEMLQSSFEQLTQGAYAQNFPAGVELIRQGEPADFLHIVTQGTVELCARWRDQSCTMAVVRPVESFILAACIRDAPYLMSARTLERSRVIMIPAPDLRAVFRRDPEFAVSVIGELAGGYRAMVRHAKGLKLRTSRERVAAWLITHLREIQDAQTLPRLQFTLPMEKRLIASYLGMTPENLSRTLKALEADGLDVAGQNVTIRDYDRLVAVAGLDPLLDGPDR